METISGFDIPKRELTQEEKTREITFERFKSFHLEAGEDFLDQCCLDKQSEKVFLGFLLAKRPDLNVEILKAVNSYIDSELYEAIGGEEDHDCEKFYTLLAEFANLTTGLKERINQILIQVEEHYNG
jgi:hypothetical protein